jgi:hypothetical protein
VLRFRGDLLHSVPRPSLRYVVPRAEELEFYLPEPLPDEAFRGLPNDEAEDEADDEADETAETDEDTEEEEEGVEEEGEEGGEEEEAMARSGAST